MAALARSLVYGTVFLGLTVVYLPARVLAWTGAQAPSRLGALPLIGLAVAGVGALVVLTCIFAFALRGKGTPAPFDPPRRLVQAGLYRHVRNPMYAGDGLIVLGVGIYFGSLAVVGYAACFLLAAHLFVCLYEEPKLRRLFGPEYDDYCATTPRWLPAPWRKR